MDSNNLDIVLNTADLAIGYKQAKREKLILDGINVSLCKGELVCFMGQNGVGKSTLLRTIAGLQKPISGDVFIDGDLLSSISRPILAKKISLVLTERAIAGNMTVQELVAYGRYPYTNWNVSLSKEDVDKIEWAIAMTKISELADRSVHELSDGQLQKVMIARALAQDGGIMILDEPTAHLDLNNRVEIINLLKSLAQETQKAILMATHELDLALQTADRLWLMPGNSAILTGIPEDLVLNGALDNVFPMKGYNLKTGKVLHAQKHTQVIQLEGEGHEYLWTKNALERLGYKVSISESDVIIRISAKENGLEWILQENTFLSINELIQALKKITDKTE
ncbi:MAG: ABC transporter ATP-binding protein [Bacteroidota bacterium]